MPIVGNLSEFPLPEVLLLVGPRTGRLRLLDIPEFGILEMDISNGAVQAVRIGAQAVTEVSRMLDKLGAILQARSGMFDFQLMPVSLTANLRPMMIHELAMKLVCHVDEQAAQKLKLHGAGQRHRLVVAEPEIWMEPELDRFFYATRPFLAASSSLDELALHLQMEAGLVHEQLTKLRLLGIIESMDADGTVHSEEADEPHQALAEKTNAYFQIARMTDKIRKLSSRLPAI